MDKQRALWNAVGSGQISLFGDHSGQSKSRWRIFVALKYRPKKGFGADRLCLVLDVAAGCSTPVDVVRGARLADFLVAVDIERPCGLYPVCLGTT